MTGIPDVLDKRLIEEHANILDERYSFFRQAFKDHNGDNAGSKATFPDFNEAEAIEPGEYAITEAGDPFPASEFSYEAQQVAYTKYGVVLRVSDEEIDDNNLSVVMDAKRQAMRAEAQRTDSVAYQTLASAARSSGVGGGDGTLSLAEIVKARAWMKKAENGRYEPDLCFVNPDASADIMLELLNTTNGNLGGEELKNGAIGTIADMEIIEANTGELADNEALLVDSSEMGYETVKWEKKVESERKPREQVTEFTVSDRLAWITLDSAAATVEG